MEFFIFISGWALTSLIVNGSIFDNIKEYLAVKMSFIYKLVSCVQCTGFWVGILLFTPLLYLNLIYEIYPIKIINYILYPALQSGISVTIESIIIYLSKNNK